MKKYIVFIFCLCYVVAGLTQIDPDMVTFEPGVPTSPLATWVNPGDMQQVNNSYFLQNYGVGFWRDAGFTIPARIARTGGTIATAFASALGNDSVYPPNIHPNNTDLGQWFLTDDNTVDSISAGISNMLYINYASRKDPCSQASGYILDVDGAERWIINIYDSNNNLNRSLSICDPSDFTNNICGSSTTVTSCNYLSRCDFVPLKYGNSNNGDGLGCFWSVDISPAIVGYIEIQYDNRCYLDCRPERKIGLAFDNFSFCSIESEGDTCCQTDLEIQSNSTSPLTAYPFNDFSYANEEFVINNASTIPITEIRATVTDIEFEYNYESCASCVDDPRNWASIWPVYNSDVGTSSNKLTFEQQPYYSPPVGPEENIREIIWSNPNGAMLAANTRFRVAHLLPPISDIPCCATSVKICKTISWKDANCNVCSMDHCTEINLSAKERRVQGSTGLTNTGTSYGSASSPAQIPYLPPRSGPLQEWSDIKYVSQNPDGSTNYSAKLKLRNEESTVASLNVANIKFNSEIVRSSFGSCSSSIALPITVPAKSQKVVCIDFTAKAGTTSIVSKVHQCSDLSYLIGKRLVSGSSNIDINLPSTINTHHNGSKCNDDEISVPLPNNTSRPSSIPAVVKEKSQVIQPSVRPAPSPPTSQPRITSGNYAIQLVVLSRSDKTYPKLDPIGQVSTIRLEGKNLYKYVMDNIPSLDEARSKLSRVQRVGFEKAFILKDGKRLR